MFLQMEAKRARHAAAERERALERQLLDIRGIVPIAPAALWMPRTPRLPNPDAPLLERGIYISPFLSRHEHLVLFAVDSRHRALKSLTIRDDRPEAMVRRVLNGLLDQFDPIPELRVI